MKRGITVNDERNELEEIKAEIETIKEHSATWEMLKFQAKQASKERFRQWITIIVLIVLLAVSNLAWLYAWMQYDYVDVTAEQDGSGINIVGGRNVDYGAEGESEKSD